MKKFIASRLTKGNVVFPAEITITSESVSLLNPSILSGKEKTIPYARISSVDINSPLIGFSTITIETTGEGKIISNGFLRDEVIEMKKLILEKVNTI